ncbi:MAG: isocyanide synthase family protein [Acidobacteriota bacterium]
MICAADLVETTPGQHPADAAWFLRGLMRHRRLLPGEPGPEARCAVDPCGSCIEPHLPRVRRFLASGSPVHMILPAFPAKSPSPRKVLGTLPDMAEEVALRFLQALCDDLAGARGTGARITICSDGRVFGDLVGVLEGDVARYARALRAMIARLDLPALDVFDLTDVSHAGDGPRASLAPFEEPLPAIAARVLSDPSEHALWCGLQRFLFEDRLGLPGGHSRTRLRRSCGELAYRVMQRSQAWSRLIAARFPHALRLSIHPQPPHGPKIGIRLGAASDRWLTPWHGVAVRVRGRFQLFHRHEAERMGGRLVDRDGRPSHFEIPC